MFALFFSLYLAMFRGTWFNFNIGYITNMIKQPLNAIGTLVTSLFNNVDTAVTDFGDTMTSFVVTDTPNWMSLVAFVLALITSIGIVVMAVKGVKKAFGIFFMGIRR